MRLVLVLLWLALLVSGGAGAATTNSGLYGVVRRGPTTPVCRLVRPCMAPAAGAMLVFWRRGHALERTRVHKNGSYRIALPDGSYGVSTIPRAQITPLRVRVPLGRFRHVDFAIDTGIR
jgi:hypothetical protein